jgi:hypothetical protein
MTTLTWIALFILLVLCTLWLLRRRRVMQRRDDFFRKLEIDATLKQELLNSINRKKRSRPGKPADASPAGNTFAQH